MACVLPGVVRGELCDGPLVLTLNVHVQKPAQDNHLQRRRAELSRRHRRESILVAAWGVIYLSLLRKEEELKKRREAKRREDLIDSTRTTQ